MKSELPKENFLLLTPTPSVVIMLLSRLTILTRSELKINHLVMKQLFLKTHAHRQSSYVRSNLLKCISIQKYVIDFNRPTMYCQHFALCRRVCGLPIFLTS